MKALNYIFLLFYFTIALVKCFREYQVRQPVNLRNIYEIYNSWFSIGLNKPIMTWDHIFYIKGNVLNAFNFKKLVFSTANIYYPYGENSYLKPIDAHSITSFNFYSIFFTKDCSLRMYTDVQFKETYFNYNNLELNLIFSELNTDCYDSLRIYYDSISHYTAVYNLYSNQIIVFNLNDFWRKGEYEEIFKVSMNSYIKKAIVFSHNFGEKILLIGMDINGNVNFWNLKDYCEGFFNALSCAYRDNLIDSFKYQVLDFFNDDKEFSTIINYNILLYINNNDFITFDLKKVKLINKQNNFIFRTSCVLGLKDGNALVGTEEGYIHLIKYEYSKIKILDTRLLCPNKEVFSLSLNSNCTPGTYFCYIIIANCRGNIKIFEIKNQGDNNTEL